MKYFKADLHIHTVLSPCADLDMSPRKIVDKAKELNIDIIGITDHNSMLQYETVQSICNDEGIYALCGVEITTLEEIHCLAYFDNNKSIAEFGKYLEQHIQKVKNDPVKFGFQVVVDRNDQILKEVDYLLINRLDQSIDEIENEIHRLNGLLVPAHIDKKSFSIISQLGFIPKDFRADAMEISALSNVEKFKEVNPVLKKYTIIQNSDAHYPDQIGKPCSFFYMNDPSFSEIRHALQNTGGRSVKIINQ